jgi:hypothetical protein
VGEFQSGREPVQYVELYQPTCIHTYGAAPCTAQVGVTGDQPCWNTRAQCQDPTNFDGSGLIVWRFTKPTSNPIKKLFEVAGDVTYTNAFPSLVASSTSPTVINAGGSSQSVSAFGRRASLTVGLSDHAYDDAIADKYLDQRSYNPSDQGTFWGRFVTRNPYHGGWRVVVYDGYQEQTLPEMISREYVVDDINGPGSRGGVSIIAKDPLKFVDNKQALAPVAISAVLFVSVDAVTTVIDVDALESDIAAELGSTGTTRFIRVDDELIEYTGYTVAATITLTGVTRGVLGTTADEHDADTAVGRAIRYEDTPVWDLVYDLLITYAAMPPAYIDLPAWAEEGGTYIPQFNITATLVEPIGVNKLIGELQQQCIFYIVWNERTKLIGFHAIRPAQPVATLTDDRNILADSAAIQERSAERISRIAVYYAQRDPTLAANKIGNYALLRIGIDAAAESPDQYGDVRTKSVHSRWLTTDNQVVSLSTRLLERYRDSPQYLVIKCDAKDRAIWTADIIEVVSAVSQSADGTSPALNWQVISSEEIDPGGVVKYNLQRFELQGTFGHYMADGSPDYENATDEEKAAGAWYANDSGTLPGGDVGYQYG